MSFALRAPAAASLSSRRVAQKPSRLSRSARPTPARSALRVASSSVWHHAGEDDSHVDEAMTTQVCCARATGDQVILEVC